mgnify:FL=1
MTSFENIFTGIEQAGTDDDPVYGVTAMLGWGEYILENWIEAQGQEPTQSKREGFRILALHRQGARGNPSFNACRETCRELVYHYNLILEEPNHEATAQRLKMATLVARHLCLFVQGKMEEDELGDFCCSARPIRTATETKGTHNHA